MFIVKTKLVGIARYNSKDWAIIPQDVVLVFILAPFGLLM